MMTPEICKSDTLRLKYGDRWEKLKILMDNLPSHELLLKCDLKEGEKNPAYKFSWQLPSEEHPYFNVGFDTHVNEKNKHPIDAFETFKQEYTLRKKVYISDKNVQKYESSGIKDPVTEYFLEMKRDFDLILKYYYDHFYPGIQEKYEFWTSLMLIEYACPFATKENSIEQRTLNTEIWGPSHCDETLGGIHLGENVQEFQASFTGEDGPYQYFDELMDNQYMFFFGEESEKFGHMPTFHRMIPHPTEPSSTRYSIIMDLVAKEL